jgi:hypothetical protein
MATQNQNFRKPVTSSTSTSASHDVHDHDDQEEGEGEGEIFGVILRRTCSVSSAPAHHDVLWANEKQKKNSPLESAVRRALSMRKSPPYSVSVGYSRIHHKCDSLAADDDVDDDEDNSMRAGRSKKKRGKNILKACRRLFGF